MNVKTKMILLVLVFIFAFVSLALERDVAFRDSKVVVLFLVGAGLILEQAYTYFKEQQDGFGVEL